MIILCFVPKNDLLQRVSPFCCENKTQKITKTLSQRIDVIITTTFRIYRKYHRSKARNKTIVNCVITTDNFSPYRRTEKLTILLMGQPNRRKICL